MDAHEGLALPRTIPPVLRRRRDQGRGPERRVVRRFVGITCNNDTAKFKRRNLEALGSLIVGNVGRDDAETEYEARHFPYRSSMYITEFFQELETDYQHDGSTRHRWVADVLEQMLAEPHDGPNHPPAVFCRLIDKLMSPADRLNEGPDRPHALAQLNEVLGREGFEAFYGDDSHCYLRHVGTQTVAVLAADPHRPFSKAEQERRQLLAAYLDQCSEDDLIEEVLLPLFRQLGYHRTTAAGHKDKALEYGKDIWMRYTLPTQRILYFGIQAKKGKLDAAGVTKDHQGRPQLDRQRSRRQQAQSDHVHGPRRHPEPLRRCQPAATRGSLAAVDPEPVADKRRGTVLGSSLKCGA